MSDLYEKYADKYDQVVRENIYNALLERPSTFALLDDLKGQDIVDMGCGSGVYAEYFIDQSANKVTCVDASSEMVGIVNRNLHGKVNAYVQDLNFGLPIEAAESADVIISSLVLHYIEDLTAVFKDVYRVLKPGGYMVFSTHHPFADFECSVSGNYFEKELIHEEWDTVGTPVNVSFYRRSLTEICDAVTSSGLFISKITEGCVDERAKQISEETYERLKNNPNFIFMRCEKPLN
jgi:SAM-dependent methyltransferase